MDKEKSFTEEFIDYIHKLDERITNIEEQLEQDKDKKDIARVMAELKKQESTIGSKL